MSVLGVVSRPFHMTDDRPCSPLRACFQLLFRTDSHVSATASIRQSLDHESYAAPLTSSEINISAIL